MDGGITYFGRCGIFLLIAFLFTACNQDQAYSGVSSNSSSSSSSSSSSASSSSGFTERITAEYCPSSVGTDYGEFFEPEDSANGRIDFVRVVTVNDFIEYLPDKYSDRGELISSSFIINYNNPSSEVVVMTLWTDNSDHSIEIEFQPTDGWSTKAIHPYLSPRQVRFTKVSLLSTGETNGILFKPSVYKDSYSYFAYNSAEKDCPEGPLLGVPIDEPTAPTIQQIIIPRLPDDSPKTYSFAGLVNNPNLGKLTFLWDFGDGSTGSERYMEHAYERYGVYFPSFTVTDAHGNSDTQKISALRVRANLSSNSAPKAKITLNKTRTIFPDPIIGSAIESTDTDNDPLEYYWTTDGGSELFSTREEVEIYSSMRIGLSVSDGRGGITWVSEYVEVIDAPEVECKVDIYDLDGKGKFRMIAMIANNTPEAKLDWQARWEINNGIEVQSISQAELLNINPLTVSGLAKESSIPPYSWIEFDIFAKGISNFQELEIKTLDDLDCTIDIHEKN